AGDRVPGRARRGDRVAAALDPELARVRDMTVQAPAPPALPEPVEALTRRLRLPYLRNAAPEVLATARAQRWDPAEVVRVLLSEEAAGRDKATIRMRRRASGLPAGKTFDVWDEAPRPSRPLPSTRSGHWNGSGGP